MTNCADARTAAMRNALSRLHCVNAGGYIIPHNIKLLRHHSCAVPSHQRHLNGLSAHSRINHGTTHTA